jgi:hypothetical protein
MCGVPALDYEVYWQNENEALREAYKEVMTSHPQAKAAVVKVYEITDITRLAGCTPKEIGESKEWANTVKRDEASRARLCGTLEGETLFSALYGIYMLAFMVLKAILKKGMEKKDKKGKEKALTTPKHEEGFMEPEWKRRSFIGDRPDSAKKQGTNDHKEARLTPAPQAVKSKRNFFAPLRDLKLDEAPEAGGDEEESENSQRTGRDRISPIIITTQINLLKIQEEIKAIAKGSFELRNIKNGTRVISREVAI